MNDENSFNNNNFLTSGARPKVRSSTSNVVHNERMEEDQPSVKMLTHKAEYRNDLQMPEVLLPQKLNFDLKNWKPEPPAGLHLSGVTALERGYEVTEFSGKVKRKKSRLLCRRGAVVLHKSPIGNDLQGERKLRIAAQQGSYDEIQNLLQDGVNPNRGDEKGRTALHFAVTKGYKEIVQSLLDGGSDVNQKDGMGNSPLHLASISGQIDVVTTLLESGADCHDMDRSGHTPIHLAYSRLKHLKESASVAARQEVFKLIGMLRLYMSCTGREEQLMKLDNLSERMNNNYSPNQPIDEIQDILESFTNMNLQVKK